MASQTLITPIEPIAQELEQSIEAREENATLTASVMHIAEDLAESIDDVLMPDPITAGILIGLSSMERLQGVIKQTGSKRMPPAQKQHRNLDSLLQDKQSNN